MDLKNFFNGKKIFVTGHTGFKATWLCLWLKELGAEVTGYSLPPEDIRGNLFKMVNLENDLKSIYGDIRNLNDLDQAIKASNAEIIFHLAAQPLVIESYNNPIATYDTNVMGTINLLEAIRKINSIKTVIVVTTDKCYENNEWLWPYRETDRLGGYDPYSSSKAMAELAVNSYKQSFLSAKGIGIATARAGNVIGGGDFAKYRIIPDIVESITKNEPVIIRNPNSVRPWQHVLDAICGYMFLAINLNNDTKKYSTAFNFSPDDNGNDYKVEYITKEFIKIIGKGSYHIDEKSRMQHEAGALRLDSSRAKSVLGWKPQLGTDEAILWSAKWYGSLLNNKNNIKAETIKQIQNYMSKIHND